jgi:hypothetical protein
LEAVPALSELAPTRMAAELPTDFDGAEEEEEGDEGSRLDAAAATRGRASPCDACLAGAAMTRQGKRERGSGERGGEQRATGYWRTATHRA